MAVPRDDLTVFVGGDRDLCKARWSSPGDLQLRCAVEHQSDRTSGFFRHLRGSNSPIISGEFRAEAATDVNAVHSHVGLI